MTEQALLIGDIGGTNARFALADSTGAGYSSMRTLNCTDFETAEDAIERYLGDVDVVSPGAVCLAVAGPIDEQRVHFTNSSWIIDANELRRRFKTNRVRLLNDFEAIAYAIPVLGAADTLPIGLPAPIQFGDERLTVGALGPGTGLGAVGLKKVNGQFIAIPGEAAHAGFAPETRQQSEVLTLLRERFERVSRERLVSGPGLENLYWALCRLHEEKRAPLTA
ncbi:MAG: glucokinase, partial [Halioglobus sp.]|nr:glucokinase [Halioglobus sp.]